MIRLKLWLLFLAILTAALADPPKPVIVNAVTDRYRPLAFDQQKLTGLLANRIRANTEGYLEHTGSTATAQTPELSSRELEGLFLDAAVDAYEYTRHQPLKSVMDRVAKQLLSALASEGTAEASDDARVRRDELLGLIAYYRLTGDENALAASKRIGDALTKAGTGQRLTAESGILLEPMVYLYRYTGEERYLNLCRSIAIGLKASDRSVNDASYENLSNLIGLVELYRITGDESYFKSVLAGWAAAHRRLSLTGAVLPVSGRDSDLPDACVTASWAQLTLELLRITGDPHYGQQLERTTYNQLFVAQDPKTGMIFSKVQWSGTKTQAQSSDQCAANEARAISAIPAAVWGRYGNGIAIMQYTGGRATFQLRRRASVQIYSEATYPETGEILLHIEPGHNVQFPLRLRVPDWANKFIVDIGETHLIGDPGEFLTLNREWKRGDTVKIAIDMAVRVIDGSSAHPEQIAIQRGPQILAVDKTLNPDIEDLAAARPVSTDPLQLKLTSQANGPPANWGGDQAYSVAGEYRGRRQQLILVPFADAVSYSIWMTKPAGSSGAN